MSFTLITAPAIEPVSLADARLHCRIDSTAEDDLLAIYITAARQMAEELTNRALITQQWRQTLDAWPAEDVRLDRSPQVSIDSVTYIDAAGATQTLSSAAYALDAATSPGWLIPADGSTWPSTDTVANAVSITYTCGYGAAASDVPAPIRSWILLTVGYLYAQREAVDLTGKASAIPSRFVDRLLDPYIVYL